MREQFYCSRNLLCGAENISEDPTVTEQLVLAIDLGTSALKVALVTMGGDILACEQETQSVSLLPNGGAEQNPDDWWTAIMRAAKRVLGANAARAQDVAAVACTTQWS